MIERWGKTFQEERTAQRQASAVYVGNSQYPLCETEIKYVSNHDEFM
jgi:hypothetical protein